MGVFPGLNKLIPLLVAKDQLLCFPEPLIPAKGFSCNKTLNWCLSAIRFIISINKAL